MRMVQRKRILRVFSAQTLRSLVACQERQQCLALTPGSLPMRFRPRRLPNSAERPFPLAHVARDGPAYSRCRPVPFGMSAEDEDAGAWFILVRNVLVFVSV